MDDKKKSVPEETKEISFDNEDVVEFDDIRNALNKLEAKKASLEQEKQESIDSLKQISGVVEDTKDDIKEEVSSEEKTVDAKEESSKEEIKDNGKAITQSKRLADAKAAKEATVGTVDSKETKKAPKKEKRKNGVGIFFVVVFALIAVVYVAGFVYFSNNFYPDVAINGTNVSNMDKETAKKTLDDFYKNYSLTLDTINGGQEVITATDILMNIQLHNDLDKCLAEQQAYLWFVNMMEHHDYVIGADVTWDEVALEAIFADMDILNKKAMKAPKDAYIGIEDGKFIIIKEELGTTIDIDKFKTTITNSLVGVVAHVNLNEAGCYELPKVYDTDEALKQEFDAKGEYMNAIINLQLDDLTLEPGMELYNAVLEKSGDTYTVSKSKVQSYVKELANQYDTLGKERTFTTSFDNGRQIKISGTVFGYEMDQSATADALYKALEEKTSTTVEVVFTKKGFSLQGENDIGDTYIEVNLSEQKVAAYKGGRKIVEGDCVSGCEANGNGTCLGMYVIQDKLSPTVLRGQQKEVTKTVTKKNKKGKKVKVEKTTMEYEYESPVTYWLQFNGGYGLHDAAGWRSVYGGSIYRYNGSHGCVNLPYNVAEDLYKNFELGDPVIVYFWDNDNRQ